MACEYVHCRATAVRAGVSARIEQNQLVVAAQRESTTRASRGQLGVRLGQSSLVSDVVNVLPQVMLRVLGCPAVVHAENPAATRTMPPIARYCLGMASEEELAEEIASIDDRTLSDEELADLIDVERSPARVTFSTQDFSIDGLVKRLNRNSMVVPQFGGNDDVVQVPGFQRGFVWSKVQMDRFIESLLLGYPVPGIFLVKQAEDNRLLILDGQQRLITLQRFYNRLHNGKEFVLTYVGDEFKGLTYHSLDESLQFKLDDSYMQATIVAADGSPEVDDSIFQIFERLNSGGTQLTPHEIRVALYAGPLMASIEALNGGSDWRKLFGAKSKRIRDHELIMRILALYSDGKGYSRPLKNFLNKFAQNNRAIEMTDDARGTLSRARAE